MCGHTITKDLTTESSHDGQLSESKKSKVGKGTGGKKDSHCKESGAHYTMRDSPRKSSSKKKGVVGSKVSKAVTSVEKGEKDKEVIYKVQLG